MPKREIKDLDLIDAGLRGKGQSWMNRVSRFNLSLQEIEEHDGYLLALRRASQKDVREAIRLALKERGIVCQNMK